MIRRVFPLIIFAFIMTAYAALNATESPIAATLPPVTETVEGDSASPTPPDTETPFIDAQLTAIASLDLDPPITFTPMPTLAPVEPKFIYEAPEEIRHIVWSPDGRWVSFWIPPANVEGFTVDEVPIFYNVETGQICVYEEFRGEMQYEYPNTYSYWQDDGYATLLVNGVPYAGLPCEEFVRAPDSYGIPLHDVATSFSPDGTYKIETIYTPDPQNANPISVVTTITSTATGEALNIINWSTTIGQHQGWTGGYWLDNTRFLITGTDQGAFLLTVGEEEFINTLPEIFDVPSRFGSTHVNGSVQQGTGNYHLLLALSGIAGEPNSMRLYHSESGQVETLPFRYHSGMIGNDARFTGFSPDGEWLLLQMPLTEQDDDYSDTWLLPVDNRDQEAYHIGRIGYMNWSGHTSLVAYAQEGSRQVIIAHFPEMEIVARLTTDYHNLNPVAWSQDGTRLLLTASRGGGGKMALFWYEP